MKKALIIFIFFVLMIFILAAGVIIFVKTMNINKFKPQIISQASAMLNRRVDFEKVRLDISLKQGIILNLSNLVIADDPSFRTEDFLSVKNISLGIDVVGYLLRRTISIPSVVIDTPRAAIIRRKNGVFNVQSFTAPSDEGTGAPYAAAQTSAEGAGLPLFRISSLNISDGSLAYTDYSFEPPVTIEISGAAVSAKDISSAGAFPFIIEGSVLSSQKNIRLQGKAQIEPAAHGITISELIGVTDLADILPADIAAACAMTNAAAIPAGMKGKVQVTVDELIAGPGGLLALKAAVSLSDAAFQFKAPVLSLADVQAAVRITQSDITLDTFRAAVGEGTISASGAVADYSAAQRFTLEVNAENLKIQDILAPDAAPVKAEGVVGAQIRCTGAGFAPKALSSSLTGEGKISAAQVTFKDINVLRMALDRITVIPGLTEKIAAALPEAYRQKLSRADTSVSEVLFPLTVAHGRVVIKDAMVSADDFQFKGDAQAGFDGTFALEGVFLIAPEFSAQMVSSVSQLQYLLNEQNQIFLPLKVSGTSAEMKFSVDAEYIAKKLLVNQGAAQLLKVIDKAIGGESPGAGEDTGAAPPSAAEAAGGILDSILSR